MPAPGSTLCATGIGVGVVVKIAVGVTVGVAVFGMLVPVDVADEMGVFVGVWVNVAVGVKVDVGGMGVEVFLPVSSCSSSPPAGGHGVTPPVESGVPHACAETERLGVKFTPIQMVVNNKSPGNRRRFTVASSVGVNLPSQFIQLAHIKFIRRHIDVHPRPFSKKFIRLCVINSAPCFGNATFVLDDPADDFQPSSNRYILAILDLQLAREHEARVRRVVAHVCPPRDFVYDGSHNTAMQHTGEAFKMFGRGVLAFDHTGFGLVKMQMQPNGILHPADETIFGISLFEF